MLLCSKLRPSLQVCHICCLFHRLTLGWGSHLRLFLNYWKCVTIILGAHLMLEWYGSFMSLLFDVAVSLQ